MSFDVLVVGGGHAGVEAACAAARRCSGARRARVGLVTSDPATIGAMSCNPAIGGLGKGHLVREVDALDGVMARAADAAAIHHRMLNASKGSAVHGPRAQADRRLYARAVQAAVAGQEGLTVVVGHAESLILAGDAVSGLRLADDTALNARAVVLATGTFLGGRLFRGEERQAGGRMGPGGRIDERPATRLAEQLRALDLPTARLKTGTPPRLDGQTIDWARLERQPSDGGTWTMSAATPARRLPQLACALTRTNERTHDVIRANLHLSPLHAKVEGGGIEGTGPRYCPSIEDKVARFGDRDGHGIFLEPEGLATPVVYPNGISTSLPADAQLAMVRSIAGLERAALVQSGYAVEYDIVDPRALDHRLALRALAGLFHAGQINGTTGYEEAAAQGLVAGLNAAAHALDLAPVTIGREDGYLGVLIDDLVLQGVSEPYRMLTSRAEHRLRLRATNAEARLTPIGLAAGCVGPARAERFARETERWEEAERLLAQAVPGRMVARELGGDGAVRPLFDWLRHPGADWDAMVAVEPRLADHADLAETLMEDSRYAPYLARAESELRAVRAEGTVPLPATLDYHTLPGLSLEMRERLSAARPATLGEAGRMRGITPAALALLLVAARRVAA